MCCRQSPRTRQAVRNARAEQRKKEKVAATGDGRYKPPDPLLPVRTFKMRRTHFSPTTLRFMFQKVSAELD